MIREVQDTFTEKKRLQRKLDNSKGEWVRYKGLVHYV